MTKLEAAVVRLKKAYLLNNIPVSDEAGRDLVDPFAHRMNVAQLESLADHWEARYEQRKLRNTTYWRDVIEDLAGFLGGPPRTEKIIREHEANYHGSPIKGYMS